MVEFLLALGSIGMLHQRFTDALRRRRDGDWTRWCLLCRGLPLGCGWVIANNFESGVEVFKLEFRFRATHSIEQHVGKTLGRPRWGGSAPQTTGVVVLSDPSLTAFSPHKATTGWYGTRLS